MIPVKASPNPDEPCFAIEDKGDWIRFIRRTKRSMAQNWMIAIGLLIAVAAVFIAWDQYDERAKELQTAPLAVLGVAGVIAAALIGVGCAMTMRNNRRIRRQLDEVRRQIDAWRTDRSTVPSRVRVLERAAETAALPHLLREELGVASKKRRFDASPWFDALAVAGIDAPRLVIFGEKIVAPTASAADFTEPNQIHEPWANFDWIQRAVFTVLVLPWLALMLLLGDWSARIGAFLFLAVFAGPLVLRGFGLATPTDFAIWAAPGRVGRGKPRQAEWSTHDSVLAASSGFGYRAAQVVRRDDSHIALDFLPRRYPKFDRLLRLWMIPGDPAPPIFEDTSRSPRQAERDA